MLTPGRLAPTCTFNEKDGGAELAQGLPTQQSVSEFNQLSEFLLLHHRYAPNLISDRDRGFSFEAFIPRKFKSHSFAHRGARVIDTDTLLRISLVLRVSSDGQEHEQDSEDNPNVNAHQGITVELNAARTLALSRELCRVLSGRGLEIRPWPSRLVPPRAS